MHVSELYEHDSEAPPLELPLYQSKVECGFPSPADDFVDLALDLNKLLIRNPSATFYVRVKGDSMINAGIMDGAILTVDRTLRPVDGKVVVAVVNGECTVKRIRCFGKRIFLAPDNPSYRTIEVTEYTDFEVWGVVTHAINPL